jgi:PQQ-dependent dehydrogenase (methanol/ethanol family)
MYVVTPFPNDLIAVDLTSPNAPIRWRYAPHPNPQAAGVACCDWVNRGASYADGKIIYNLLDAETVAVDAKTGKEVWRTRVGDLYTGETITMAPLVVKNKVIVGNSGGELGVRGWILALDVANGKELWRAYNSGPDKEALIGPDFKPFYAKDQGKDLGVKSWPPDQWKLGGATVWGWISYDPGLDLIYYGTGNPGVWNPDVRPGDNKWSSSIIARNPDTGQARWAFQISPHDAWDYDEIMENILIDMPWHGSVRKILIHPGRTGFVFVLDRTTGELLSATKFEPTNWANSYDLKTGLAQENPEKRTHFGSTTQAICPSSTGGKEFVPSAFSPQTGLLYIPAHNTCMDYGAIQANYIAGTPYLGADVKMYPGPGGYQGELVAWDIVNARPVWTIKEPKLPVYSGVLATGGNVVFYGTMDGWFRAVDAHNGHVLWQFKTGSGIVGNPVTFLGPDGKQYVAIYSGIGGWMGATAFPDISTDDPYAALGVVGAMGAIKEYSAPGSMVYVFGL